MSPQWIGVVVMAIPAVAVSIWGLVLRHKSKAKRRRARKAWLDDHRDVNAEAIMRHKAIFGVGFHDTR